MADQATVSLLRWLRRQLRQPTPQRERLEAAVANDDPAEARRLLAVERERLSKEAADNHAAATAETDRLVKEAEMRAANAEDRARTAMAQATKHREEAATEAERQVSRARREAEQIVSTAKKQAEHAVAQARADMERQTVNARADLDKVERRRDAIVSQLAQLKEIVSQFGGLELPPAPGDEDLDTDKDKSGKKA